MNFARAYWDRYRSCPIAKGAPHPLRISLEDAQERTRELESELAARVAKGTRA